MSVVDGGGFDVGQHGGRIVETFWQYTDTDTVSLVKSSNDKLHSIFTDPDSEITKEIDGVKIGGINTRASSTTLRWLGTMEYSGLRPTHFPRVTRIHFLMSNTRGIFPRDPKPLLNGFRIETYSTSLP